MINQYPEHIICVPVNFTRENVGNAIFSLANVNLKELWQDIAAAKIYLDGTLSSWKHAGSGGKFAHSAHLSTLENSKETTPPTLYSLQTRISRQIPGRGENNTIELSGILEVRLCDYSAPPCSDSPSKTGLEGSVMYRGNDGHTGVDVTRTVYNILCEHRDSFYQPKLLELPLKTEVEQTFALRA